MFRMYVSLDFLAMSLGVSPLLVSCLWVSFLSTISLSSIGQLCLLVSFPSTISLLCWSVVSVGAFPFYYLSLCWSAVSLGVFPFHHLSPLLVSCVFGCLSFPPSLLCWSAVSLGVFPFHHLSPLLVSCVFGCLSLLLFLFSPLFLCLFLTLPACSHPHLAHPFLFVGFAVVQLIKKQGCTSGGVYVPCIYMHAR